MKIIDCTCSSESNWIDTKIWNDDYILDIINQFYEANLEKIVITNYMVKAYNTRTNSSKSSKAFVRRVRKLVKEIEK